VLASLYYIPIVVAAVSMGAREALMVSLAAGCLHGLACVLAGNPSLLMPAAQMTLFVCVAVTAAKLAEWQRDRLRSAALPQAPPPPAPVVAATSGEAPEVVQMSALSRAVAGLVRHVSTPVTSIEGAGWVLEDAGLPDEKRQEFVGIIRKESHRLSRVLSDVSDFTRPRKPFFQRVQLEPLIDEVIQLAGPKEHGPFFLFRTDIPPDFPALRCDPEQLRRALLNVAINAIQATPGGGQIEISARIEEGNAAIRVQDRGQGIPPSILGRVFDPFFTTRENCLGLGLPIALHILTEHGGRMTIESTSERGTCVCIVMPASTS
jgi:signal transduction histidine kinase